MSVDISKANALAVLSPKDLAISKANAYAVLSAILPGVSLSKGLVYAVIVETTPASSAKGQILLGAL